MLSDTSNSKQVAGKLDIINGEVILHIPREITQHLSKLKDQQKIKLEVVEGQLLISI